VSQNAIPSRSYLGGHLPYAFTQEGVAMLSSILTSKQAIEVNIQIMRAFVNLKDLIAKEFYYNKKIETLEEKQLENTKNIDKIWEVIEPKTSGIFYDGQTYDAYDFIRKLITEAKERIILIDNYIDTSVITLLTNKKPNIQISIYTRDISEKIKLSIKKANEQYPYFEIKELANCHDRFLIIDNIDIYHIGASLKDLGKKWFAFSKLKKTDIDILDHIKQNL
jgi:hypothetical protein